MVSRSETLCAGALWAGVSAVNFHRSIPAEVGAAARADRVRAFLQSIAVLAEDLVIPDLHEARFEHVAADQLEAGRHVAVRHDVGAGPGAARHCRRIDLGFRRNAGDRGGIDACDALHQGATAFTQASTTARPLPKLRLRSPRHTGTMSGVWDNSGETRDELNRRTIRRSIIHCGGI